MKRKDSDNTSMWLSIIVAWLMALTVVTCQGTHEIASEIRMLKYK